MKRYILLDDIMQQMDQLQLVIRTERNERILNNKRLEFSENIYVLQQQIVQKFKQLREVSRESLCFGKSIRTFKFCRFFCS